MRATASVVRSCGNAADRSSTLAACNAPRMARRHPKESSSSRPQTGRQGVAVESGSHRPSVDVGLSHTADRGYHVLFGMKPFPNRPSTAVMHLQLGTSWCAEV